MSSDQVKPARLSGWDFATWRTASQPLLRQAMTAVYLFDRAPDWDRLVDRFERASRWVPVLRKKVVEGPVAIANPRLVIDPDFDLSFQLRRFAVPAGAGWDYVLEDARRQAMTDFDRARPLWRVTLLEGLPGGKAAMIFKIHHALADGQGALALGASLIDFDEHGVDLGPMPEAPVGSQLSQIDFLRRMLGDNVDWAAQTTLRLLKGAAPAALDAVKDPKGTVEDALDLAKSLVKYGNQPSEPASPVMRGRSVNSHFAAFELPFAAIRSTAKVGGHTANDVFLAAIAEGMAIYHRGHGADIDHVNLAMPISTRTSADQEGTAVGLAHFALPLDTSDVNQLMDHMHEVVTQWRREPVIGYSSLLGEVSRFVPWDLVISGATSNDVVASNIPGPPVELWMAGAKIEHLIPFPPLTGAAVFVAMLTYAGRAVIGLAMDDEAVKDRDVLVDSLATGFERVTGAVVDRDAFLSTGGQ